VTPQGEWLEHLWVAWQPIVDLRTGGILGHEALIRGPKDSPWALPRELFRRAAAQGLALALEARCRHLALADAQRLPSGQIPFVNIDGRWPHVAGGPDLLTHARPLALEISESHPILDNPVLLEILPAWRAAGHRLVLDDYGTGYAAAATVLAVHPDIIKLDRRIIAGLDQDPEKRSLVASLRAWTRDLGIALVAEGIETEGERQVLQDLGCDYGQGFYLGRPEPTPRTEAIPVQGAQAGPDAPTLSDRGADTLAFYQEAIQRSRVPSYIVDRRRRVVAWNPAAAALLGHRPDSVQGLHCYHSPLEHRDQEGRLLCQGACPLVWSMVRRQAEVSVVSARTEEGSRLMLEVAVVPLWDTRSGQVVGALEQFRALPDWPAAPTGPHGDPRLRGLR
jgi:PAS domain S-box-containing protein